MEYSCEIISKSDKRFQRRRFLKNCLKNSILLPWQPEFLMESISVNNFWRGPPKEHSCQVWSKLAQRFGRRISLKRLLTTHDRQITTLKAPLEHVVLRWAKKKIIKQGKCKIWREEIIVKTNLTLSQTSPGFYVSAVKVFWKHCGKRRNCSSRAISPFPTVFSTCLENFLPFSLHLKLLSANSFSLEESKICRLGKG